MKKAKPIYTPVDETVTEETPVVETPIEETPVEEAAPVEATPVAEAVSVTSVVEETPTEEAPADDQGGTIVKVVLPADGNGAALVHTKGKKEYWYVDVTPKLEKRMNGVKIRYFYVDMVDGKPKLDRYAPWQAW